MFLGKGGVGKTTLACARAITRAQTGQRVLVASLDQAHSVADTFATAVPRQALAEPIPVPGLSGLDIIEIDSLALLEDRFRDITGWASAEDEFDLAALDPAELTGLPGVQELLLLTEITELADTGEWDLIVLDCPPSADTLRMLATPETLLGYLDRVWPPHRRMMSVVGTDMRKGVLAALTGRVVAAVGAAQALLTDHARTGVRLITAADRLAVAETKRVRSAAALLGLRMDALVVNRVLPEVPAAEPSDHPAVAWYRQRYREQRAMLTELHRTAAAVPVVVIEDIGTEPVGTPSLTALAHNSAQTDPETPRPAPSERPVVRLESGKGLESVYALRLPLPVADPATIQLGRAGDDLIVGADGMRRRLHLAPVLQRCLVAGAHFDEAELVVRFRPDPGVWPR